MKTILGLFREQVRECPDRPMITDERETLTFSDVDARSDAIGSALLRRGAGREPVLVFMKRSGAMSRPRRSPFCRAQTWSRT